MRLIQTNRMIGLHRTCQKLQRSYSSHIKAVGKKLPIAGVRNIILISSAKGGVGKSVVAVNLAYAIKHNATVSGRPGRVGILDADVYGPSLPTLTGLRGPPSINKQKMILPLVNYGVQCMSMGFLVPPDDPIVWRGLMVMSAMDKLLRGVNWGELDVLVVDMPPGTGDTQLSLIQSVPITGAVLVSTPQKVCLADVIRGANLFRQLNVPILGLAKNMTGYLCQNCGHLDGQLFDSNDLDQLAERFQIPMVGDIPVDRKLSQAADNGCPLVVQDPEAKTSKIFLEMAEKIMKQLET